ncbi:helix-turn-helix domain-containing protein [Glycomyces paridis]|uniref:Helix-turn-helix transcriptional regulator n=1 Tax=Glycomyces paridis TaxID=2126555 RepID=A0A4S8PFR5_9ACTN|nr:helix-turn-helix transcriptional regulator [Glycomyces paridis]THV28711.1 helix-turn-helix transcriptional regulator [Glycomyces paridis]
MNLDRAVDRLREARLRQGLSQEAVAERIGTTQSAVARLESGRTDPRLSTLVRYAEAVGADLEVGLAAEPWSLDRTAADIRRSLEAGDPNDALRHVVQFLDDVARADPASAARSMRLEPETTGDRRWDALLGGIAEYAGRRARIPVPGWATAPGRFLHRFWFVVEDLIGRPSPGLAAMSFASAPPELANRGVFLDRSSLESV